MDFDHKIGSLTPGKEADIVLVSTDSMNMIPMNNPVGAVVEFANTGNVDSIFVAGKARKRNGKLLDLDFASFRKKVDAARDGLSAAPACRPMARGSSSPTRKSRNSSGRRFVLRSFAVQEEWMRPHSDFDRHRLSRQR